MNVKATKLVCKDIFLQVLLFCKESLTLQHKGASMSKSEIIAKAGSASALAKLLGISRAAVSQWENIPQGRLYQLRILKPEWFQ